MPQLHYPELLTANRIYYVAPTGNDANTGTDGGTHAWRTVQHAVTWVIQNLIFGGFIVDIQLGAGTYDGFRLTYNDGNTVVPPGVLRIKGDPNNSAAVVIKKNNEYAAVHFEGGGNLWLANLTVDGNGGDYCAYSFSQGGAFVDCLNVNWQNANQLIYADGNSTWYVAGDFAIAGNGANAIYGKASVVTLDAGTITLTGTPAYAGSFINMENGAQCYFYGTPTFSGAATGKRFSVSTNAVIDTGGQGFGYFPGSVDGTTATGGVYA